MESFLPTEKDELEGHITILELENKLTKIKVRSLQTRIKRLEKSLILISDIAYDQDGYADTKSLTLLIEELRLLALKALRENKDDLESPSST